MCIIHFVKKIIFFLDLVGGEIMKNRNVFLFCPRTKVSKIKIDGNIKFFSLAFLSHNSIPYIFMCVAYLTVAAIYTKGGSLKRFCLRRHRLEFVLSRRGFPSSPKKERTYSSPIKILHLTLEPL